MKQERKKEKPHTVLSTWNYLVQRLQPDGTAQALSQGHSYTSQTISISQIYSSEDKGLTSH